jgi:CheY-like chemotaxis protein
MSEAAGKNRILLVDDEPILTKLLGKLLEQKGYATRGVNRSTEVVEHVRQFKPHAVVLDVSMPQLNGYEVARQFRAEPGFEGLLIIAVSGYGDSSQAKMSLRTGMNHHLTKPVQIESLHRVLINELGQSAGVGGLEDRAGLGARLAEVNARIDQIVKSPEQRLPGEYGSLVEERSALERRLKSS